MDAKGLEVIWQDQSLIAINKPSGLLVHRSEIDRHETRNAIHLLRDQLGQRVYPIHRLDKPTSGLLVFAFEPKTARAMTEAFTMRRVKKTYIAIARGIVPDTCLIDYPLKEAIDRYGDPQANPNKPAQTAVTRIERLSAHEIQAPVGRYQTARYSVVRIHPETGRKHQIRRHLKHIFHPIVGDTTHGDGAQNQFFRSHLGASRLMLHAQELSFEHPATGCPIQITATTPEDMANIIALMPPFTKDAPREPEPPT